jgi:hypothetical protein
LLPFSFLPVCLILQFPRSANRDLDYLGGPFEYWLRRTRAQNISDPSVIDECLDILLEGEMPDLLRRHSRAAAGMPFSH